jgi:hypothetical protein
VSDRTPILIVPDDELALSSLPLPHAEVVSTTASAHAANVVKRRRVCIVRTSE